MTLLRARLYAFAFVTTLRRVAGLTLSRWIRIGLWLVVFILLLLRWWWVAAAVVVIFLTLRILYGWARRNGYVTFVPLDQPPDPANIPLLPGHQKISVRATGTFSVGEREHFVLLRKADMWHVPVDEHAIMVERIPGSYLYQFVEPDHLDGVRIGHFMFGQERAPGLEIAYQTDWSPKVSHAAIAYYVGGGLGTVERIKRKIYVAFESDDDCFLMWKSLCHR